MSIESFFVILLVVILGWYISFSASRLDRLHHRVETSWATLDALLQQRASTLQLCMELRSYKVQFSKDL